MQGTTTGDVVVGSIANMSACALAWLAVWMYAPKDRVHLLMMQHMAAGLGAKQAESVSLRLLPAF